jgi:hypothetical protein
VLQQDARRDPGLSQDLLMQLQQESDALQAQSGQFRHGRQLGRDRRILHHQCQCPAQRRQLGCLGFVDLGLRLTVAGKQFGDPLLVLAQRIMLERRVINPRA